MNYRLRTWPAPFFGLVILSVAVAGSPTRTAARTVRIANCRISLIDQAVLACDRPGILKTIECKEGMEVVSKQVVAVIADDVARATLAVAEMKAKNDVDVRFSEKASELAAIEYRKSFEANAKGREVGLVPVAVTEVNKLELAAQKAVLAIEQAKRELELNKLEAEVARAELATLSVVADFDGVVTRVFKKRGEAVRQGDPIVEVINTGRVKIEGRIGLSDLHLARQGERVKVRLSIPELDPSENQEWFEGHLTFVDQTSDPVTRETRVFAEVKNRNNILRAGLMAELILESPSPK